MHVNSTITSSIYRHMSMNMNAHVHITRTLTVHVYTFILDASDNTVYLSLLDWWVRQQSRGWAMSVSMSKPGTGTNLNEGISKAKSRHCFRELLKN